MEDKIKLLRGTYQPNRAEHSSVSVWGSGVKKDYNHSSGPRERKRRIEVDGVDFEKKGFLMKFTKKFGNCEMSDDRRLLLPR